MRWRVLVSKAVRRAAWEVFRLRVHLRRALLDIAAGPRRQARAIQSVLPTDCADVVLEVPRQVALHPDDGYAVVDRLTVLEASVPHSASARRRSEMQYFNGVPSLSSLLRRGPATPAGRAVTLRHPYDHNYFHATVDCCGALALLDSVDRLAEHSVVVGEALATSEIFSSIVSSGLVEADRVVVQRDRWVECDDLLIARPGRTGPALLRTFEYLRRAAAPSPSAGSDRRLYLLRGSGQGRQVRDEPVLRELLEDLGFEAVDAGELSWTDQVELFTRTSSVVGVHGAAFTNILYRAGRPMRVVEIQSPGGNETMFASMAAALGFDHHIVLGTNPSETGNRPLFDVDVAQVVEAVGA